MAKEHESAAEEALEGLRQRVFASAFGAFDPKWALSEYARVFEKKEVEEEEEDYEIDEYTPETEEDVLAMINSARRAGAIQ